MQCDHSLEKLLNSTLAFFIRYLCQLAIENGVSFQIFNPLRPNNDVSQTSHCNIKGVSVSEVMRIENMITQVKFS